jgi:hypothetical protein
MFDIDYIEYNPFGETTLDTLGVTRQGYIGKEKDVENNLGDHTSTELSDHTSAGLGSCGIRKNDFETVRFNKLG